MAEHAPLPGDGATLLDDLAGAVTRFVAFPNEAASITVALWIVHTYAFAYASATPYLNVHSPVPRCGKSTLFEVLSLLVYNPVGGSNVSPAVLYRIVDAQQPTLLLDEMDAQMRADRERAAAMQSVLNAGYKRGPGATVWRCAGNSHTPEGFNVFCPKAFAGVGMPLHATTLDRCIPILLERKLPDDQVERFRSKRFEPEAAALGDRVPAWIESIDEQLTNAEPPMPDDLNDRSQEIWEPLLAIADAAGGRWPSRAREAALELHGQADLEDLPLGVLLLADIQRAFDAADVWTLSTDELRDRLNSMHESPWPNFATHGVKTGLSPRSLARMLRPFGVRPKTVRMPGDGETPTRKGYRREWFEPVWARYLADVTSDDTHDN